MAVIGPKYPLSLQGDCCEFAFSPSSTGHGSLRGRLGCKACNSCSRMHPMRRRWLPIKAADNRPHPNQMPMPMQNMTRGLRLQATTPAAPTALPCCRYRVRSALPCAVGTCTRFISGHTRRASSPRIALAHQGKAGYGRNMMHACGSELLSACLRPLSLSRCSSSAPFDALGAGLVRHGNDAAIRIIEDARLVRPVGLQVAEGVVLLRHCSPQHRLGAPRSNTHKPITGGACLDNR